MGLLILLQVALDLGLIAGITLLLIERSKLKTQEDPRLSRGLQLLSSKIAILQDLMDRSETIGRQLSQLIDHKQQDVQERIEDVEVHLHKVQAAIEKSQAVAKIFQDKIPHQEIIERQTTLKYYQAAKMANQGMSIDDIAKQVEIPRGELDLIIKLNRDRLIVREEPSWANSANQTLNTSAEPTSIRQSVNAPESTFMPIGATTISPTTVSSLPITNIPESTMYGPTLPLAPNGVPPIPITASPVSVSATVPVVATPVTNSNAQPTQATILPTPKAEEPKIRPVIFRKISILDDLG